MCHGNNPYCECPTGTPAEHLPSDMYSKLVDDKDLHPDHIDKDGERVYLWSDMENGLVDLYVWSDEDGWEYSEVFSLCPKCKHIEGECVCECPHCGECYLGEGVKKCLYCEREIDWNMPSFEESIKNNEKQKCRIVSVSDDGKVVVCLDEVKLYINAELKYPSFKNGDVLGDLEVYEVYHV